MASWRRSSPMEDDTAITYQPRFTVVIASSENHASSTTIRATTIGQWCAARRSAERRRSDSLEAFVGKKSVVSEQQEHVTSGTAPITGSAG